MVELKRPETEMSLVEKDAALRSMIAGYGALIVAYSGGVDSTFLAGVAHEVLGHAKSLAVTSRSPVELASQARALPRVISYS